MATLTAQYFDDFGRVQLDVANLLDNVTYRIQRSTELEPTWVNVRGAQNITTESMTRFNDYEYTPNMLNKYRLLEPSIADNFDRTIAPGSFSWGSAPLGGTYTIESDTTTGADVYVDPGFGVIETPDSGLVRIALNSASTTDPRGLFEFAQLDGIPDPVRYRMMFNRDSASDTSYEMYLRLNIDGSITTFMVKTISGTSTQLNAVTSPITWSAGDTIMARTKIDAHELFLKLWIKGTDEPDNFQMVEFNSDQDGPTSGAFAFEAEVDGGPQTQRFGTFTVESNPPTVADTAEITPSEEETFLKSIMFPALNRKLDCVDWQQLTRNSRAGFFNVKGRHEILGIWDVGSSATFDLTFITRTRAENRAITALLSFGGVLLLQPPGDDETIECNLNYSGIPGGYVMPNAESSQVHAVHGQAIWQWNVVFTRVAASDIDNITPTLMTWEVLWDIIGPEGTWEDVWAMWSTWQEVWEHETTT